MTTQKKHNNNNNDDIVNNVVAEKNKNKKFDIINEILILFNIALPSILVQLFLILIFPQGASIIGHYYKNDIKYLDSYSLGSLIGNLTCISIIVGSLSSCDTLMSYEYGKGTVKSYNEIGLLAIRGIIVGTILLLPPVLVLYSGGSTIEYILVNILQQQKDVSILAIQWIQVYILGLPANLLFRTIQRFLVTQHRPWAPVYASCIPCILIQPILLRVFVPIYGFIGSAISIVITQWCMMILLIGYIQYKNRNTKSSSSSSSSSSSPSSCFAYHPNTWSGISKHTLKQAIEYEPMKLYVSLSLGGVASLSEWWFWEIICIIAGTFGNVTLCAHTIIYNIIPMLFMLPLGISIGLTVRIGNMLASDLSTSNSVSSTTVSTSLCKSNDNQGVQNAKQITKYGMGFTVLMGCCISLTVYHLRDFIIGLFTIDRDVVETCNSVWILVCYHIFILNIFCVSNGILRGLGKQWNMAFIVAVTLYCGLLPCILYWSVYLNGGFYVLWFLMPTFYAIMTCWLAYTYITTDWSNVDHINKNNKIAALKEEEEVDTDSDVDVPTETSYLLQVQEA